MSVTELKQQIHALPMADRIELAMSLWDSIDDRKIESPAWHAEVLAEREAEIESGQAEFLTLDQMKARFGP
ncbi:MAG: addiction module protein [Chthoniobacterales bacterium]